MPPKIVVITGPTATGKTALGIETAKRFGGEVVSADSMQIYRRMDIGTAKVTPEEMQGIPHHMIDVCDPEESYSAARYVQEASACVDDILSRGKLPIVVGGTGLYIDSLISGRDFAADADETLRRELSEEYDLLGGEHMLARLAEVDPSRAAVLHVNDKKRIVRALETYISGGVTISDHDERTKLAAPRYEACKIALTFENRQDLYDRINLRVDLMMERGLEMEVRKLMESGTKADSTAMQAIGYKEMAAALRGECTLDEAVETIKMNSRRYAKRQLSWLRRDESVNWITWKKEPDVSHGLHLSTGFFENCDII